RRRGARRRDGRRGSAGRSGRQRRAARIVGHAAHGRRWRRRGRRRRRGSPDPRRPPCARGARVRRYGHVDCLRRSRCRVDRGQRGGHRRRRRRGRADRRCERCRGWRCRLGGAEVSGPWPERRLTHPAPRGATRRGPEGPLLVLWLLDTRGCP
ncbi:MAG: hypothetical protein FVQ78_10950, partial [Solirubrobacterales bacterium]|nr:hypothetical protein [Solirubrobacterales bacterium]